MTTISCTCYKSLYIKIIVELLWKIKTKKEKNLKCSSCDYFKAYSDMFVEWLKETV